MRNLINVVLFVLVLFGSVVPASAQEPQARVMTADVWAALIGFGTLVLTVIIIGLMIKSSNDAAHTKIGDNIKGLGLPGRAKKSTKGCAGTTVMCRYVKYGAQER